MPYFPDLWNTEHKIGMCGKKQVHNSSVSLIWRHCPLFGTWAGMWPLSTCTVLKGASPHLRNVGVVWKVCIKGSIHISGFSEWLWGSKTIDDFLPYPLAALQTYPEGHCGKCKPNFTSMRWQCGISQGEVFQPRENVIIGLSVYLFTCLGRTQPTECDQSKWMQTWSNLQLCNHMLKYLIVGWFGC